MRRERSGWCCALVVPLALVGPAAAAQATPAAPPAYAVTDLGTLNGDYPFLVGGVNVAGQVTGSASGVPRAFRWDPVTGMTALGGIDGAAGTAGFGINDAGDVVGSSSSTDFRSSAALWEAGGAVTDLGAVVNPGGESLAWSINNAGLVAGTMSNSPAEDDRRGFLWSRAGGTRVLPDLPGGRADAEARAVNASALVAGFSHGPTGFRAVVWDTSAGGDAAARDLGELPGGANESSAWGVSDGGIVVGMSGVAGGTHAFSWTAARGMVALGDLPGGGVWAVGMDVNDDGIVVGFSTVVGETHAFVWTPAHGMLDLNGLLDASGAGWTLHEARGINAGGQISGLGRYDPDGPGGQPAATRGFLLTPVVVPEPAALWPAVALIALLRRRRRRG